MSDMPRLRVENDAVLIPVRAAPGASRDAIAGLYGDAVKIAVTAPPERGKANQAIIRVLARRLGLKRSSLCLHTGATSRDKWIRVEGIPAPELEKRLRKALEKPESRRS